MPAVDPLLLLIACQDLPLLSTAQRGGANRRLTAVSSYDPGHRCVWLNCRNTGCQQQLTITSLHTPGKTQCSACIQLQCNSHSVKLARVACHTPDTASSAAHCSGSTSYMMCSFCWSTPGCAVLSCAVNLLQVIMMTGEVLFWTGRVVLLLPSCIFASGMKCCVEAWLSR